ncbi:hypothetical protein FOZ61_006802 [Perkinsus olseni]|uniref:Uncharacterized protein n=1 Tax=Perkinsus olseni TaxID=32597 RepID=A0A7J6MHM1_PEROL|nr:hypothetical protein FOZ61_006802 [Perkinsus olseni]KAF4676046.1 hypothetical protein FOL46_007924 [Perkinsus olseni]
MSLSAFFTDNRLAAAAPRQGAESAWIARPRRQEDPALRARQKEFFACEPSEVSSGITEAFANAYKAVAKEFSAATKEMQPQPNNATLNKLKARTEESASVLSDIVLNGLMYVREEDIAKPRQTDPTGEEAELKALQDRYAKLAELRCRNKRERERKLRDYIKMEQIVVEKLEHMDERMASLQQQN